MDIIIGILIAIFGILLVIIIKLSTTFFHEMGHAIPALIFTKKSVEVYIGSYGDISKTTNFSFGRLKIYFKWNVFDWKMGMCRQEEAVDKTWKNLIILFGSPIASILISIPLIINLKELEPNSLLLFISIIFIAASVYDFFVNMIPYSRPLKMHDGEMAHSDGFVIYSIISRQFASEEFLDLEHKYLAGEYSSVVALGEKILESNPKERFAYDFMISSMVQLGKDKEALDIYNRLNHHTKLIDEDYYNIGKLHKSLGNYAEALKYFNHYRYKNYDDLELLSEIGITQVALGNNEEALETLNAVIQFSPNHLQSYTNRGKAYLNLERYDLAEADLVRALKIKNDEAEVYYLYGVLHERLNRNSKAIICYERAKQLNSTQHGLDFKIENLRQ